MDRVCRNVNDFENEDNQIQDKIKKSISLLKEGSYNEAISTLDKAIELGTLDLKMLRIIYNLYGHTCEKLGDYEKACTYFQYAIKTLRLTSDVITSLEFYQCICRVNSLMGNRDQAARALIEFIEFSLNEKNPTLAVTGRLLLSEFYLDEAEKMKTDDESITLVNSAKLQLDLTRKENDNMSVENNLKMKYVAARIESVIGDETRAMLLYQECIEGFLKEKDNESLEKCYLRLALNCHKSAPMCSVYNMRMALDYAKLNGNNETIAEYTIILASFLNQVGLYYEAYVMGLESLKLSRELNDSYVLFSMSTLTDILADLNDIEKNMYFLVTGSLLSHVVQDNEYFRMFYEKTDRIMSDLRKSEPENENPTIRVDASDDPTPVKNIVDFVRLEDTESLDSWKQTIMDIHNKRIKESQPKKEEPPDFFDMFEKLSKDRMDDQRAVLKNDIFTKPSRPLSSLSKKKSSRFLPGLRENFYKLGDFNPFMKRSKTKSKLSVNSDSQSQDANIDGGSSSFNLDKDTLCSASDLASWDSGSINKEAIDLRPNSSCQP